MVAGWPKAAGIEARAVLAVTTYLGAVDFADHRSATYLCNEYPHRGQRTCPGKIVAAFLDECSLVPKSETCACSESRISPITSNHALLRGLELRAHGAKLPRKAVEILPGPSSRHFQKATESGAVIREPELAHKSLPFASEYGGR
jgi:hypothetical protein